VVKCYQIQIEALHDLPHWYAFMQSFYGSIVYNKIKSRSGVKHYSSPYEAFASPSGWSGNDPCRWMLMISYDRDIWTQAELDRWREHLQNYIDKHRVGLVGYYIYPVYLPESTVNFL